MQIAKKIKKYQSIAGFYEIGANFQPNAINSQIFYR